MTRASLLALAARVEAAEGADRALDFMILKRLRGLRYLGCGLYEMNGWYYCLNDDAPDEKHPPFPSLTSSLDAAASLVPEGWGIELSRYWVAADERPRWRAHLTGGLGNLHGYCKEAMSGALALTAAALRAMAEEAPHE